MKKKAPWTRKKRIFKQTKEYKAGLPIQVYRLGLYGLGIQG